MWGCGCGWGCGWVRVRVWSRSVFVGDDCNIFTNIYPHPHFQSREARLVPHPQPPDYLKFIIEPKRTCSFLIYFNSTWCWCICATTMNKNKSFSNKETLSGLSLLIEKKNRCYLIVNFLCIRLTFSFSAFSAKTVSITLYIFVLSYFYALKNMWSTMLTL